MTSPFKSTQSVASRRRHRPVIERSTFVIAALGAEWVAFPVEQVERVLRLPADASIRHDDRTLPVTRLSAHLGLSRDTSSDDAARQTAPSEHRVLIVRAATGQEPPLALRVDGVSDVFPIETALVQPLDGNVAAPTAHRAVRGWFTREDRPVWVLDAARLEHRA